LIRSTCGNSYDSNIRSTNLIADRQWRDLMKKKIWFVINSSHDWSLKCIFFKWNIKRHFITFFPSHTHKNVFTRLSHLFPLDLPGISAPLFCNRRIDRVRFISIVERDHGYRAMHRRANVDTNSRKSDFNDKWDERRELKATVNRG